MKATDLMINDLFYLVEPEDGHKVVINIHPCDFEEVIFGLLEPIPLTHEIIKANGFDLAEVGDNGIGTPRKLFNRYEKHECKTQWFDIIVWYDRMTKKWSLHGVNSVPLEYVHQLQHAMRLIGMNLYANYLNDFADNFKIEEGSEK